MKQNKQRTGLLAGAVAALLLALVSTALCLWLLLRPEGFPTPPTGPDRRTQAEAAAEPTPVPTLEPTPEPTPVPTPEPTPVPTPEPTPETWQSRFAEHFSAEVIREERRYSSPTLSVTVTEYAFTEAYPNIRYFVADIYLSDVTQLQAAFSLSGESYSSPRRIAEANEAVIAINGDSALYRHEGFVLRNGVVYNGVDSLFDLCALYYDGRMEILPPYTYLVSEVLENEPYQIWQFGPNLLDTQGKPLEDFNADASLWPRHPRTVLGYYEPGHYCFVVVDGRGAGGSAGADLPTLAKIMSELGCAAAYNLDGGISSVLVFCGEIVSHPADYRSLSDMLVVREQTLPEG